MGAPAITASGPFNFSIPWGETKAWSNLLYRVSDTPFTPLEGN